MTRILLVIPGIDGASAATGIASRETRLRALARTLVSGDPSVAVPWHVLPITGSILFECPIHPETLRRLEEAGILVCAGLEAEAWHSREAAGAAAAPIDPKWPIQDTGVRDIGTVPSGVVVGFLDSRMPQAARASIGLAGYREFPPTAGPDLWHSAATTFLVRDPIYGAAPEAEVVVAAVLTYGHPGHPKGSVADVIHGLEWLLAWEDGGKRVSVVNVSMNLAEQGRAPFAAALANAKSAGHDPIVVAASGNGASQQVEAVDLPAALDGIFAVGAVTSAHVVWERSGWRAEDRANGVLMKPDIVAPGVSIWTIDEQGQAGFCVGTSLAAPFVTAAIARLLAAGEGRSGVCDTLVAWHTRDVGARDGHGELYSADPS